MHFQYVRRATARTIRPTQSAQRAHFAFSTCAPRHSESDSTHPKCAEGSLCIFNMRAAPQRERFDPPKVRRRFTLHFQNTIRPTHSATARAIRPTQSAQRARFAFSICAPHHSENDSAHFAFSTCAPRHSESDSTHPKCAEGSLCIFNMRAAPQRERFDPPKVRRRFTLHFQHAVRPTRCVAVRAIRPTQSEQRVHFAFAQCGRAQHDCETFPQWNGNEFARRVLFRSRSKRDDCTTAQT